jgi:hypothetical protein
MPKIGVTKVGEVANTSAPDPVSSVTAVLRFALDGVVRKVANADPVVTPVPPLATGRMPDTSVVRTTCPYEGVVPFERSTVLAAPLESFDKAVVVLAYRISPTAYDVCPVPPEVAVTEFWVARVPKPKVDLAVEASACLRNPVPDCNMKEDEPISVTSPEPAEGFPRTVYSDTFCIFANVTASFAMVVAP